MTDLQYLIPDEGLPCAAGDPYCGWNDGIEPCWATAAFTAWITGQPAAFGIPAALGIPVALCPDHAADARAWPETARIHTVRPAGQTAHWYQQLRG